MDSALKDALCLKAGVDNLGITLMLLPALIHIPLDYSSWMRLFNSLMVRLTLKSVFMSLVILS